ncbi:hypothetical protein HYV64_05460 [Candidatus Shapirobacteria bacterium]|nr:hypothetical protein [Candidatus Shapirobacteria bacterium]
MNKTVDISIRNYDPRRDGPILSRCQKFSGGFLTEETVTISYQPPGSWVSRPGPIENGERTTIDVFIPDRLPTRQRSDRSSY